MTLDAYVGLIGKLTTADIEAQSARLDREQRMEESMRILPQAG